MCNRSQVEKNILKPNPVPSNISTSVYLDEFLRRVLEENNKHFQIQQNKLFQKIQQKLLNVMRLLSKTWQKIEEAALREKCPSNEFFLVRVFLYLNRIRRFNPQISVFSLSTKICGPEKSSVFGHFSRRAIYKY